MISVLHSNTLKLLRIEDKAIFKYDWNKRHNGQKCFCETVARMSGELGNEHPSNYAIRIAKWLLVELRKWHNEI